MRKISSVTKCTKFEIYLSKRNMDKRRLNEKDNRDPKILNLYDYEHLHQIGDILTLC